MLNERQTNKPSGDERQNWIHLGHRKYTKWLDALFSDTTRGQYMVNDRRDNQKERAPVTNGMIERFNRETVWLATGVLGTVVFAALVLAVQDRLQREFNPTERRVPAANDNSLNSHSAALFKDPNPDEVPASSVDHAFTEILPNEIPTSQMGTAASTATPVLALTPDPQHATREIRPIMRNGRGRSPVVRRLVDVKRRLIALWHQSLALSDKPGGWAAFSKFKKGARRTAAYTAETNH